MAAVLITGSTTGLGRGAAIELLDAGHEVVLHARSEQRAADLGEVARRAAAVVLGDLASRDQTRALADQVNALGRMDAVIHNAAVYVDPSRIPTPEGHARTFAVNTLAPYLLTVWIERPDRLIYLSSGMHRSGDRSLRDLDWTARRWNGTQAYCDSKLHVAALAAGLARRWPEVLCSAVNPGWVPTRMGGPSAPDDLDLGARTQAWLAVSRDAPALASGGYWFHQRRDVPADAVGDETFQDALLQALADFSGVPLP